MTTSIPANASSPANISPVGPPPAITTACSVISTPRTPDRRQRTSHGQHVWGACGKPPRSRYVASGGVGANLYRRPWQHERVDHESLEYYATPGRFTILDGRDFSSDNVREVVEVVQGLLVYDVVAQ